MNLVEFKKKFGEEKACRDWLAEKRWGNPKNAKCPYCNHEGAYVHKTYMRYTCKKCIKQFTVKSGTIFENSKLPLTKWFLAIYFLKTIENPFCISKSFLNYQFAEATGINRVSVNPVLKTLEGISNGNNPFLDTAEIDKSYFDKKKDKVNNNKIEL